MRKVLFTIAVLITSIFDLQAQAGKTAQLTVHVNEGKSTIVNTYTVISVSISGDAFMEGSGLARTRKFQMFKDTGKTYSKR